MQSEFPGGQISTNENIQVYISPVGTTAEEKAGNVGHELYGHALMGILGKDPRHGGATGGIDGNNELEKQIDDRMNESKENQKKTDIKK